VLPLDVAKTLLCTVLIAPGSVIATYFIMALQTELYILKLHTDSAELSCTLCTATAYVLSCSTAQHLLKSLHWLLVSQRISFKLATLAYKIQSTSNLNNTVNSFSVSILVHLCHHAHLLVLYFSLHILEPDTAAVLSFQLYQLMRKFLSYHSP